MDIPTTTIVTNVRSLNGEIDELCAVTNINDINVVCITETWLNKAIPDCVYL